MGYNGNQLSYVTDAAVKTPDVTAGLNDFKDASSATSGEYAYNRNGAMSKDLNKGISNIAYNSLNLPIQLTINAITNSYKYAANGAKLKVTRGTDVVDYVGNKVYEKGSLKRILVDGGYIENGVYHFYIQDHQGNNRVVATGTGTVVQRNHYYPFGMTFGEIATTEQDKQAYKYNGKELDRKNGLNLYDYSARYMEPALGRFTTMDPLAEKYYSISPYAYCVNNPVRFVDPDGKSPYYNKFGKFLGVDAGGFSGQIMIASDEAFKYSKANNVSISESNFIQDLDLSARALSTIYTHVIEQANFSTDLLENGAISVIGKNDTFNSPNAATEFLKTSFTMKKGSKFKISLKDDISSRSLLNTVENAINAIGDHEYTGHGVMKLGPNKDHHKVYEYQMDQPAYKKTTENYKKEMMKQYKMYILEEFR